MKLLFDHNLSPRLCNLLAAAYPDSAHVFSLNLHGEDDLTIWSFAEANDFTIVSKDADFHQLAFVKGPPPKVVWIQLGNCSTEMVSNLLIANRKAILEFAENAEASFLALE